MPLTYEKKFYPVSWKRSYTPPTPPVQYVEMSFDTSSQYITSKIPPFTVTTNDTVTWDSYYPNTLIFDIGASFINLRFELADEWTSITGIYANATPMSKGVAMATLGDILFTPIVVHQIIHRDTQGPCPNGFHIGTKDEWQTLINGLKLLGTYSVGNVKTYLKIPEAYYLNRKDGTKNTSYGICRFWTSTMTANNVAWAWGIDESNSLIFQEDKPGNGFSIRPFKDNPVVPDNTWTTLVTNTKGGIYWSSTLGLISITADSGSHYITISDKNLGATNVLDNGLFYQFGNNTGYTYNASPYVTKKPTISSSYGPGNYYTGSFVRISRGNNWFNGTNNNIWGGVTNSTWTDPV